MAVSHNEINKKAVLTTTDDTTVTLIAHTMGSQQSAGQFEIRVLARRTSDGLCKGWVYNGVCRRVSNGAAVNVQQVGTDIGIAGDLTALAGTAVIVAATTTLVRVRVTGQAATDIVWSGTIIGEEVVIT